MAVLKKSGRAGSLTVAGATIAITKWSAKLIKKTAGTTDSDSYDAASGRSWEEQVPVSMQVTGSFEFKYDFNSTNTAVTAKVLADAVVALVLKLDATTTWGSGNADLTDVETNMDTADAISGTANFLSNRIWVIN